MNLKSFFTDAQIEQIKSYVNVDELNTWLREHALALGLGMGIGLVVGVSAMALASGKPAKMDSSQLTPDPTSKTATPSEAESAVVWPEDLSPNVQDLALFAELLSPQPLSKALLVHYVTQRYPGLSAPSAFVDALLADARFIQVEGQEGQRQLSQSGASTSSSSSSQPTPGFVASYSLMLDAALATMKQLATAQTPMSYYVYTQAVHDKLCAYLSGDSKLTKTQRFQLGQSLHAWAQVELQNQQPEAAKAHLEVALTLFKAHYGEKHIKIVPVLADLAKAYGALGDATQRLASIRMAATITKDYDGAMAPDYMQLFHTASLASSRPTARVGGLTDVATFHQIYYGALSHPIRSLVALQLILAQQIAQIPDDNSNTYSSRLMETEQQLKSIFHFVGTEAEQQQARVLLEEAKVSPSSSGISSLSLLGTPSSASQVPSTPSSPVLLSGPGAHSPSTPSHS